MLDSIQKDNISFPISNNMKDTKRTDSYDRFFYG